MTTEFANKPAFAAGFNSTISRHRNVQSDWARIPRVPQFRRPGKSQAIQADAGLSYRHPERGAAILVVVELECSGPGNETNVLKWYEAMGERLADRHWR